MNNLENYLIKLFFVIFLFASEQPAYCIHWAKTLGNSERDEFKSIHQISANTFVINAMKDNNNWIFKIDLQGNLIWEKEYNIQGGGFGALQKTNDGGFILTGGHFSTASPTLAKLDQNGEILWHKYYQIQPQCWSFGNEILQTNDNGYIAGSYVYLPYNYYNALLMRFSESGDILWAKHFGVHYYEKDEYIKGILLTDDGGYLVAGETDFFSPYYSDIFVSKFNDFGNIVWQKAYGRNDSDKFKSIIKTSDNCYLIGGSTTSFGAGDEDLWIIKIDQSGNVIWNKTLGSPENDNLWSVRQLFNGGFLLSGSTAGDGLIIKTDHEGNIIWQKTYGGAGGESISYTLELINIGLFLLGDTTSYGAGSLDLLLMQSDTEGNIPLCNIIGSPNLTSDIPIITACDTNFVIQDITTTPQSFPFETYSTPTFTSKICPSLIVPCSNIYSSLIIIAFLSISILLSRSKIIW